jgi:hypothetical protein
MSSFGPWFDPTLFRGSRRYGGAVFVALAVPAIVGGYLLGGWFGSFTLLAVVWVLATIGADRWSRRRDARRATALAPRPCHACGDATLGETCPTCGGPTERAG